MARDFFFFKNSKIIDSLEAQHWGDAGNLEREF